MTNAANTVRIGMVRRPSISMQPNRYQISSKVQPIIEQPQPNDQATPHQVLEQQISNTFPENNKIDDHPYSPTPRTPRSVRLNNTNEANNGNQHYSNIPNSPPSTRISPITKQTTTTDMHEIPSKKNWSMSKKILVGLSAALLVCTIIIVPTVVLLTQSTGTTTLATTVASPIVSVMWSFDNTTTDLYGVYNGQLINGATYTPISTNQPYFGYGQALTLSSASSQSFAVPTPFLDLTYKSFTIEAWVYVLANFAGDRGVFGQCQCSTCTNQCLYFIIRANHLYISFTSNDLSGSSTISATFWNHIAFVYNYQTQQQILYVNGVQDTIKSNANPYQGTNGTIQIGETQVYSTTNYFNGYIDNVKVTTRAKSATEILNDASLIAHYSFDLPSPNNDNGPNGINGTSTSTIGVSGRVNQAMRFTSTASYFQAYGFYQLPGGVSASRPFSISMWINPSLIIGCTFVQVSQSQLTSTCANLLGIWSATGSTGQITAQGYQWPYPTIYGPYVTTNTWVHISWTYSLTNGYSLYVNGVLFGSTGSYGYTSFGMIVWLQIGFNFACVGTSSLANVAYQGSIDEIYVHNRELSQADVTALANP